MGRDGSCSISRICAIAKVLCSRKFSALKRRGVGGGSLELGQKDQVMRNEAEISVNGWGGHGALFCQFLKVSISDIYLFLNALIKNSQFVLRYNAY